MWFACDVRASREFLRQFLKRKVWQSVQGLTVHSHRILSLVVARFDIDKSNQYPPILTEFYHFKQMKNYPYERPKIVVSEISLKKLTTTSSSEGVKFSETLN